MTDLERCTPVKTPVVERELRLLSTERLWYRRPVYLQVNLLFYTYSLTKVALPVNSRLSNVRDQMYPLLGQDPDDLVSFSGRDPFTNLTGTVKQTNVTSMSVNPQISGVDSPYRNHHSVRGPSPTGHWCPLLPTLPDPFGNPTSIK